MYLITKVLNFIAGQSTINCMLLIIKCIRVQNGESVIV